MKIFVFGNEDLEMDSLPVRMVPEFQRAFPEHKFILQDPNEEWDTSEPFFVIDTVVGLAEPQLFDSLDAFVTRPRMSMHDFDAFSNLRFLQKLGKLPAIKIIGLPVGISEEEVLAVVDDLITNQ